MSTFQFIKVANWPSIKTLNVASKTRLLSLSFIDPSFHFSTFQKSSSSLRKNQVIIVATSKSTICIQLGNCLSKAKIANAKAK